jgi:tRNA pseudouridine13 synthase
MRGMSEPNLSSPLSELPRALGTPACSARFRSEPSDFVVDEHVDVPEHATGAHWWLRITKTGLNTKDVVRALAELGSARARRIGYAGLKDRHAVTSQWFSVPLENLEPETIVDRMPEGMVLEEWRRARHAVRRGGLRANRFRIRLRQVTGEPAALSSRLDRIVHGVPNYFGEQRFGRRGENLVRARRLFDGTLGSVPRFERGLYLSAARSWLFNLVLAERVRQGNWNQLLEGEAVMLDGSRSWFRLQEPPATLAERLEAFDIHPSGPLVGTGERATQGPCADLEDEALATESELVTGLQHWRLRAERRSLRLIPRELAWSWEDQDLLLSFALPPGTFATTVLRELADLQPA